MQINAQNIIVSLDKSPMDMDYLPNDYPHLKLSGKVKDAPIARIIYGRPQKNGRQIFNGIVKYGEVWRLGANEATELEIFKPVKMEGKLLNKGRYTLYCIPDSLNWTIIINKDNFCWGSFSYNSNKDVARIKVPIQKTTEPTEIFTMYFEDEKGGGKLNMLWDDVKVSINFQIIK